MLENRNNNRKTGQKGQVKRGFKQEQHSNVNLLDQNSNLAEDYYFKLSKFAGNKTVQRMVEDGSMFNHQQTESTVDMKGLTQRKVKEVNSYVPPKKVAPKNYVKKSSSSTSTNKTGLPDQLKSGIENLANMDLSDIRVHYNSKKPKDINAHAFTQGSDIHVAPGQEKHLAHEAWHVVQQKQGRVKPTTQVSGVNVNDNKHLEREADVMGAKALKGNTQSGGKKPAGKSKPVAKSGKGAVQRKTRNLKRNVPVEVMQSDIIESVEAAKIVNEGINKYNTFPNKDKSYKKQLEILSEIIAALENLELKKPEAGEKKTVQKMAINRVVAQLAKRRGQASSKKNSSSSRGSSKSKAALGSSSKKSSSGKDSKKEDKSRANSKDKSGAKTKAAKPLFSEKKFKSIKRKIQKDAAMESEAVNEQVLAMAMEERNRELGESKAEGDKQAPEQRIEGQNNGKTEASANEQEEVLEQSQQGKNGKITKDNANQEGEQGSVAAPVTEQEKGKNRAQNATLQGEVAALRAGEEQARKEDEQEEIQESNKKNSKGKKVSGSNSPQAQSQKTAKEKADSAGEREAAKNKKQKKLKEKLQKKKEKKEKKEELKKKLKEQPAFDKIRSMANQGKMKAVLEQYGLNWFTAKEHLTTLKYAADQKEYKQRLNVMKKLLIYRDKNITPILKKVLEEAARYLLTSRPNRIEDASVGDLQLKKGKFGYDMVSGGKKIIQSIAPGSTSVTSDIDITFSAPGNEDYEAKLVQDFNNKFRGNWSASSGIVFDVNAYTAGFLSMAAGKREADEKEGEKDPEYKKALGEQYESAMESMNTTQLALGLLPVRQYFGKDFDAWHDYFDDLKDKLGDEIKVIIKDNIVYKKTFTKAVKNMQMVFQGAEKLYVETERELQESRTSEEKENEKNGGKLDQKHLDALASDRLYERQLDKVSKLLSDRHDLMTKINELMKKDSKEEASTLKTLRDNLSMNMQRFDVEQGKALVYANEAYYNAGSAVHVVEGMQKGKDIKLGREGEMQSLMMNIGYKLQHYTHQEEKDGHGSAMVNTSKYGQRIEDALKRGKRLEKQSKEDIAALNHESELLKKNKKLKSVTMPANNIYLAEQEKGREVTKQTTKSVNLNVALNELVSYYIGKLKIVKKVEVANKKQTDK